MGVSLSIENAPEAVVERLRRRAARNHRSLEGELMSILTVAADDQDVTHMTLREVAAEIHALGLTSADESVAMIREDRDRADGRR